MGVAVSSRSNAETKRGANEVVLPHNHPGVPEHYMKVIVAMLAGKQVAIVEKRAVAPTKLAGATRSTKSRTRRDTPAWVADHIKSPETRARVDAFREHVVELLTPVG